MPTPEPLQLPAGRLDHATGTTDVLFRFDSSPDLAISDLSGELFQPGPEFTLYGDGTVIFRDDVASNQPSPSRIVRTGPFKSVRLDEDQVQAFLRFALDPGGLWDACERFENPPDSDAVSSVVLTFHAGGIEKRVENVYLSRLFDYISAFGDAHPKASVWMADRYWGNLLDASIFQFIGDGVTPGLAESGSVAWPWPSIAPTDFIGLAPADLRPGRRALSAGEAAVLGLADGGGVVQRVYLRGPDGKTIYYFSMWPMSPDEPR